MPENDADQNDVVNLDSGAGLDGILDLNFVPHWAREAPSSGRHPDRADRPESFSSSERGGRRDRDRKGSGHSGARPGGPRKDGASDRRPPQAREAIKPGGREKVAGRPVFSDFPRKSGRDAAASPRARVAPMPVSPVLVRFLPDQRQLGLLVRKLRGSAKCYPLHNIVSLFLKNPSFCCVRLELEKKATETLWQCRKCGMVSLDRVVLTRHLLKAHLEDYFEKTEVETDPPSGSFVCVARCKRSGILLGPPNHNMFEENVLEVQKTMYPELSLEEYRSQIEMLREPEMIEKWREESRKQRRYVPKGQPAASEAPLKWSVVSARFISEVAPSLLTTTRAAVLDPAVAWVLEDRTLAGVIDASWQRECRGPRSLAFALRGALFSRGFYPARPDGTGDFVCPVAPVSLPPERAVDEIREVLLYLIAHQGSTRAALVEALRPGVAADSPEAIRILSPLKWLVEKGHILEVFDGRLFVPPPAPAAAEKKKPQVDAEAAEAVPPTPVSTESAEQVPPTPAEST